VHGFGRLDFCRGWRPRCPRQPALLEHRVLPRPVVVFVPRASCRRRGELARRRVGVRRERVLGSPTASVCDTGQLELGPASTPVAPHRIAVSWALGGTGLPGDGVHVAWLETPQALPPTPTSWMAFLAPGTTAATYPA